MTKRRHPTWARGISISSITLYNLKYKSSSDSLCDSSVIIYENGFLINDMLVIDKFSLGEVIGTDVLGPGNLLRASKKISKNKKLSRLEI